MAKQRSVVRSTEIITGPFVLSPELVRVLCCKMPDLKMSETTLSSSISVRSNYADPNGTITTKSTEQGPS